MELFEIRDSFHGARAKATVDALAEVAPLSLIDNETSSAQRTITPLGHTPLLGETNTYGGHGATGLLISFRYLRALVPSENKVLLSHWGA